METQSRSPIALMCRQGKEGRCDSATLVGWCWCPLQREKSSTPKKKRLQVWVRHQAAERCHSPPPTTSSECSHELLSGIERGLILRSGEVRLRPPAPFPRVWSQQTSKTRRAANALEIHVWNEREMVRATTGAQNIITAKEREG